MLKKVLASLIASAFAVSVYAQAPKSDPAAPKSQPAPAAQPAPGGSSATTAPMEKKGKTKAKKKSSKKAKAKAEDKK
jgi:hypothetical protein